MPSVSTAWVALAAFCWGLSGGLGGLLLAEGWDAFVIAFYRGAIGLFFVLIWLMLRPQGHGLANHRLWCWATIAGLGVAGNFAFYFLSIREGSVVVAAMLMYCAPVFVFFVSFALGLERATPFKWCAIAAAMIGIALLTRIYNIDAAGVTPAGLGAGLLAGMCYALFIFGFKYAAPHGSPQAILVIAFAVLTSILIWPADTDQTAAALTTSSWPLFAAIGVLGAGLSFIVYVVGLKYIAPAVAAVVAMVEPVTAALFGVMVLSENLVGLQILGMALILVTVTWLSVYSSSANADR
ncbi:MAG: EamA family transporter [Gammaproteobacteria bacterium]|nr:EamA family transporter [Gammaproteobacteria bacterium]